MVKPHGLNTWMQGSGKTSLLQILAGQRRALSGKVELNDTPIGPAAKRHIGMLPQEDVILSTVTVEEALQFSAALRLPVRLCLSLPTKIHESFQELK
jgi:ABC-type multidrug transport system ATPase subunit